MRKIEKSRISLLTVGGTSTAYGVGYGNKPVVGEVVRIDFSGAGLGGSGFYTITESGGITSAGIAGSALNAGEMDWNDSVVPMLTAKDGTDTTVNLIGGSAYARYVGVGVPLLTVSGCNAGSLTMDIHFRPE